MQNLENTTPLTSAEQHIIWSFKADGAGMCKEFDDYFNALPEREQLANIITANQEYDEMYPEGA